MVEGKNEMQDRISRFRALHEQNPGARYFAPLADLLRQEGQHDEALRLLGEGLERHDDYLAGWVIRGRTLQEVGRSQEAFDTWQRVRSIDPDNILALEYLAEWAIESGDWERAEPMLEHLCRLLPEDAPWCDRLAEVRREAEEHRAAQERAEADKREEAKAGPVAQEEAQQAGGSFETMTLVDIYLAQGYRDQALSVLQRMLPGAGEGRDAILERIRVLQNVEGEGGTGRPVPESVPEAEGAGPEQGPTFGDRPERTEFVPSAVAAGAKCPRRLPQQEREQRQEERARRRDEERRQFEAWLARIRLDGEEH